MEDSLIGTIIPADLPRACAYGGVTECRLTVAMLPQNTRVALVMAQPLKRSLPEQCHSGLLQVETPST